MNIGLKFLVGIKVLLGLEKDEFARLALLKRLADWIFGNQKYRLTFQSLSWFDNRYFNEYLKKFGEDSGYNCHRRFMLYQLLRLVEDVEGDTAECGVHKGASSWLICAANKFSKYKKTHYCFDSFQGLSRPCTLDSTYWRTGDLFCEEEVVKENLKGFRFTILKGWIPEGFKTVENNVFSFIHVDVDLYQPTLDSVMFFYPRLNERGIMLFDDYGFKTCVGATRAIDLFFRDKPEKPVMLPSGGAFIIKGFNTGSDNFLKECL